MQLGLWAALALGTLQGATEFLPVSSSGHVAVGAWLFGIDDLPLVTIVFVHGGTLLATIWVFRGDLTRWVSGLWSWASEERRETLDWTLPGSLVATVPTAAIALAIEDHVEVWAQQRAIVGAALCLTAGILWIPKLRQASRSELSWLGCFLVGCAQGVAVVPGISRSGMTLAAAMLLGLRPREAFRFSFLCSFPAITGALVRKLSEPGSVAQLTWDLWVAGLVAFFVGLAALLWLKKIVSRGKLWMFSLYLLPLGAVLILSDTYR